MKIYVAARFGEKDMVRQLYKRLQAMGHTITADWTQHANIKPYNEHETEAAGYAREDLDGTISSDVFIYITSSEVGAGLSAELGAALAAHELTGKPRVFVVGDYAATNAFHYHPAVTRVKQVDDVIAALS